MSTKIEIAVPNNVGTSPHGTEGKLMLGRPLGTGPSVATPSPARSHCQLMSIDPITAIRAPGILGEIALPPKMTTITPTETATVVQLTSAMFSRVLHSLATVLSNVLPSIVTPLPVGMPSMPPTWPNATWMPTPVRKPISTVRDMKSARKPRPIRRAMISSTAAISATMPASATY